MRSCVRVLVAALVGAAGLATAAGASAGRYIVVLQKDHQAQGIAAIHAAGGAVLGVSKVAVATVSSRKATFEKKLLASGVVAGVAHDARFGQKADRPTRFLARASAPNPIVSEQAACAALYSLPTLTGPDPLGVCQWDMRAIGASSNGSYAVDQGQGSRIGDIDTGIDLSHPDIAPNLDVAASCSFIYATTPTSNPAEQVTRGDCSNKAAVQDLNGHGTHTAGTIAAPINGIGVSGVAPKATIVALKAGTEQGYFFTDSVVDALVYAGDQHLDAVNMSFFADPWLFNCRNDKEQKAIIQAISRAAAYAQKNGVVLVAAAGNDGIDLNHPITDEVSPDFPPGAAVTRPVNNSCVVMPTEIPGVIVVTATGAQNLLSWYSTYGNVTDVAAPGGSRFQTPANDAARGRVLSTYSHTAGDLQLEDGLGRLVQGTLGEFYVWANGTSMASPHVTGVVALIRSAHPGMSVGAVVSLVRSTATPQPCPAALDPGVAFFGAPVQYCKGGPGSNNFYGKGLLNALAAATK
jgi:subtilisin family serine protease